MAFRKTKSPVVLTDKVVNGVKAFTPEYNHKHFKFVRLYDGTPALMTVAAYKKRKEGQLAVREANREKKRLKEIAAHEAKLRNMFK